MAMVMGMEIWDRCENYKDEQVTGGVIRYGGHGTTENDLFSICPENTRQPAAAFTSR